MPGRIRRRLTYANVIATLALFLALNVGAYAAFKIPPNSIGSAQLKNRAVTPKKVSPSAIKLFRGKKGEKGPEGPKGLPGAAGAQGTAVGFAAVDAAGKTTNAVVDGSNLGGANDTPATVYVRRTGTDRRRLYRERQRPREDARPGRESQHGVGDVFAGAAGPRFLHLVRIARL